MVLRPEAATNYLHEAIISHGLDGEANASRVIGFMDDLPHPISTYPFNVIINNGLPAGEGGFGHSPIDMDGELCDDHMVIQASTDDDWVGSRVVGLLHNRESAGYMGTRSTGSARIEYSNQAYADDQFLEAESRIPNIWSPRLGYYKAWGEDGYTAHDHELFAEARRLAKARGDEFFLEVIATNGGLTDTSEGQCSLSCPLCIEHRTHFPYPKRDERQLYVGGSMQFESLSALMAIRRFGNQRHRCYALCEYTPSGIIPVCEEAPSILVEGVTMNHSTPDVNYLDSYHPMDDDPVEESSRHIHRLF
jgi:hypothetical protein